MCRFPFTAEFDVLVKAQLDWEHELVHIFGEDAFVARRDKRGEGEEGSELSRLFAARTEALIAWRHSEHKLACI